MYYRKVVLNYWNELPGVSVEQIVKATAGKPIVEGDIPEMVL
jgi:hypothetical protein